jgi:hypothetical protein
MTTAAKRSRAGRTVPVPAETLAELTESVGRVREANHTKQNAEQIEVAIERAVERAEARRAAAAAVAVAAPAAGRLADVPLWIKITGAIFGAVLAGLGIIGVIWSLAIAPVNVRLTALELAKSEQAGGIATALARQQAAESKAAELTAQVNTTSRIRDQAQQALTDRLRGLELSDQSSTQVVNALAQSVAGIMARIEEMLRRQERLENRLGGARSQSDEAPALFFLPFSTT